jgi:hypothetical protein
MLLDTRRGHVVELGTTAPRLALEPGDLRLPGRLVRLGPSIAPHQRVRPPRFPTTSCAPLGRSLIARRRRTNEKDGRPGQGGHLVQQSVG